MGGAINPLPAYAFMASIGTTLLVLLSFNNEWLEEKSSNPWLVPELRH
jgi:hypothetical protein